MVAKSTTERAGTAVPAAGEPAGGPRFTYASPVYFDELDPWRTLHNARYAIHVERANLAWYAHVSKRDFAPEEDPDQFVFVRDWHAEFTAPMFGPGTMWIDIWLERLGRSSSTYAFSCRNEDETVEYARGRKTIVKVDPRTASPVPWTDRLREAVASERARAAADARPLDDAARATDG